MELKLPVKDLKRLNLMLAMVVSTVVLLFLLLSNQSSDALLFALMGIVIVSMVGFGNLFILITLNKRFPGKRKKLTPYRYLLGNVLSLIIYFLVWPFFAPYAHDISARLNERSIFIFMISSAMLNSLVIIMQNFIVLGHEKAHADLELARLKTAHAEAANLLLRQQIHPHFLFNALNTLRLLYRKQPDQADNYLVHLANFLRASVSNHEVRIARLDEELLLADDYVAMQKIRFGSAFNYHVSVPDNVVPQYYLPSFSLQPLVENAIKHNEFTEETPLNVLVSLVDGRIIVSNNLRQRIVNELSTGNGLANLAERYRLWTGDEIKIERTDAQFSVSIQLLTQKT